MSKSEFIRQSIVAYAAKVVPTEQSAAEIDASYIGQTAACAARKP